MGLEQAKKVFENIQADYIFSSKDNQYVVSGKNFLNAYRRLRNRYKVKENVVLLQVNNIKF